LQAWRLFAAVALSFSASPLAAQDMANKPVLEKTSFYLSSAGFRVQFANDSEAQKALRALPAHRFVAKGTGNAMRYVYAQPEHLCIFVGTPQAYDNYRRIVSQPVRPTDNPQPDYKSQAGMLLMNQPPRQSTRGDPTNLSDYLHTLPSY
jgi:hypothetical protein